MRVTMMPMPLRTMVHVNTHLAWVARISMQRTMIQPRRLTTTVVLTLVVSSQRLVTSMLQPIRMTVHVNGQAVPVVWMPWLATLIQKRRFRTTERVTLLKTSTHVKARVRMMQTAMVFAMNWKCQVVPMLRPLISMAMPRMKMVLARILFLVVFSLQRVTTMPQQQ